MLPILPVNNLRVIQGRKATKARKVDRKARPPAHLSLSPTRLHLQVVMGKRASGERRGSKTAPPQTPRSNQVFDLPRLPSPLLPVGARLLRFSRGWEQITTDELVLSVVKVGYRIELSSKPPLSSVTIPFRLPHSVEKRAALLREINLLVDKEAVEELDPSRLCPGFYGLIFLVPKKNGTFRPVFNLKPLNAYVHKERFKMKTPRDVTDTLHVGDWVVSIDLKDAYLHVPIHEASRHLLRFSIRDKGKLRTFQFRALPFGLSSAPRIFTRMILPVGHHVHMLAMILLQYLDDWLLKNQNRQHLTQQRDILLEVTQSLGWIPNLEKSQLEPTQRLVHIGTEYHLDTGLIYPPIPRIQKMRQKISVLLETRVTTALYWVSLLGLLNSAADAIPLGRLHLRPLHFYLYAHWDVKGREMKALIPVIPGLVHHHLKWWMDETHTRAGNILDMPDPQTYLFTDASMKGWGAHTDSDLTMGSWTTLEISKHINHLELLAVKYAIRELKDSLRGKSVMLMTDNATAVSYLKKQGGTRSIPLYLLARDILLMAQEFQIILQVKHIPGERNALADLLSRRHTVVHTEWTLLQGVADSIFHQWEKPSVDLFATRLNNRLPIWISPMADPRAMGVDALSISWKGMYGYAFPPFILLTKVVEKVARDHPCELILIAPKWPNQSWYARILDLLVDCPLVLPARADLLYQPHTHKQHQSLQAVSLHAWRLSSNPSKREDFRRTLPCRSPKVEDTLLEQSMIANGEYSLVGVLEDQLIHSRPLFKN